MNLTSEEGLTLTHYKEPLKPVVDGYGYYGALLATKDGAGIQCHICGKIYGSLALHITQTHKIAAREYKKEYGLLAKTALVSEKVRQEMKERGLELQANLSTAELKQRMNKARRAYKEWLKSPAFQEQKSKRWKMRLEYYNKEGTCPDQLLDKIVEVTDKIGKTPTLGEFMKATGGQRYKHLIISTFGSWLNALGKLGLKSERNLYGNRTKYAYTDEQLLDYLRDYQATNKRIPTATDCRRGLLPGACNYIRHFGSFPKARELAGIK